MPIIYIEGIKPPCKPYHVVPLVLLGEREIQRLTTPVYDSPSEFTNFQIQIQIIYIFAFVRSRRDLKEKNCRDWSQQLCTYDSIWSLECRARKIIVEKFTKTQEN